VNEGRVVLEKNLEARFMRLPVFFKKALGSRNACLRKMRVLCLGPDDSAWGTLGRAGASFGETKLWRGAARWEKRKDIKLGNERELGRDALYKCMRR